MLLGLSSFILAVLAFVFSLVFFIIAWKVQQSANNILNKIGEKLDLVTQHTSRQLEKFIDATIASQREGAVVMPVHDETRNHMEEEVADIKREVLALGGEIGLDQSKTEQILSKVESAITETVTKSTAIGLLIETFGDIEHEMRNLALIHGVFVKPNTPPSELARILAGLIEGNLYKDIENVIGIRNKVAHGKTKDFTQTKIESNLKLARQVLTNLKLKVSERR